MSKATNRIVSENTGLIHRIRTLMLGTLLGLSLTGIFAMQASAAGKVGTVVTGRLNVRTEPSTDSEILTKLEWGQTVRLTRQAERGWYEIKLNGKKCYVNEQYISTKGTTGHKTYLGNFTLTAYCGCARCCGVAGNLTASGTVPTQVRTVAMGGIDFGTKLLINGVVYTVEDRGTSYGHVDIFFNSHQDAVNFGMQSADVYLLS